jgi:hypothetical protein
VRAALAAAATLLQVVSSADPGRDVCADSADQTETTSPASITEWFLNWYPQTQTEAVRPLECICEAGELLFVPRGPSSSFPPSRFPSPPLASLGAMSRARLSSACPLSHGLASLSLLVYQCPSSSFPPSRFQERSPCREYKRVRGMIHVISTF